MVQALATNNTANIQRTELFVIATTLLGAGASVNSDTRRGRGYNSVQVLARANAAATGRIRIFQSVDGGTTWILTDEEASQIDAVSGESVVFISAAIFGEDVRVQFTNTSGGTQTAFDIQAYLIPHGGAGGGGGGGGGGFAADTRNADADADFAEALIGMLTNSRLGAVDNIGTGDYRRLEASLLSAITGVAPTAIVGLETAAHAYGSDSSTATVRAIEARRAIVGADIAPTTVAGFVVNSRTVGLDAALGDYNPISADAMSAISGSAASGIRGLYVNAMNVGIDNTGAAVIRSVEARSGGITPTFADTLVGLLTKSELHGHDGSNWQGISSALPSAISGVGTSAVRSLYTNSVTVGIDNTGAAVLRPVEARNFDAVGDVASTLIGLTVNSRTAIVREGGEWSAHYGYLDPSSTLNAVAATVEARESGYFATSHGRRFSFTHQTPGTLITAQATFVATTPTLMVRNAAGNTSTLILRTVRIDILEATTAPVLICIAIDTADRLSAGGTAIVGQNWDESSATAFPGTNFLFNPTATAAGGGTRYLLTASIPAGIGQSITINFKDGVRYVGTGTALVYVWDSAGANAADITETVEVEAF